jgi:hypothetical protein
MAFQRATPPVHRDRAAQPMLDPVPLGGPRRQVTHGDLKPGLGGKLGQPGLPGSVPGVGGARAGAGTGGPGHRGGRGWAGLPGGGPAAAAAGGGGGSPLAGAVAALTLTARSDPGLWVTPEVGEQLWMGLAAETAMLTDYPVRAHLGYDQVGAPVWSRLRDPVWDGDALWAAWAQVGEPVWEEAAAQAAAVDARVGAVGKVIWQQVSGQLAEAEVGWQLRRSCAVTSESPTSPGSGGGIPRFGRGCWPWSPGRPGYRRGSWSWRRPEPEAIAQRCDPGMSRTARIRRRARPPRNFKT